MKPFDLEAAKAGAKVQTRDGRPVRILATDRKHKTLVVAGFVPFEDIEHFMSWSIEGKFFPQGDSNYFDLFMAPVKKEYWVAVVMGPTNVIASATYPSEQAVIKVWCNDKDFIKAIKIHEEEI